MTRVNRRTTSAIAVVASLALLLLLGLLLRPETREASPTLPAALPSATVTTPTADHVPGTYALGERIEIRPNVLATVTARHRHVKAEGTGARIGEEPTIAVVEVTVAYDNGLPAPLAGMGMGMLGVETFNGENTALSWSGKHQALGTVMPNRGGKLIATVEMPDSYTPDQPITVTVPYPRTLEENGDVPLVDAHPAYVTGIPTAAQ